MFMKPRELLVIGAGLLHAEARAPIWLRRASSKIFHPYCITCRGTWSGLDGADSLFLREVKNVLLFHRRFEFHAELLHHAQ